MADKQNVVVAGTVELDTSKARTGARELGKELGNVKSGLKDTGAAAKATGKDIDGASGNFKNIRSELTAMPGPLGSAASGVGTLTQSFKALLANPIALIIVAIVGALKLLYNAFTSTASGADKMEQVFDGIGAVIDVVYDRVLAFANAFLKFLSGDFTGAIADGREALRGFGDEVVREFNQAADATARLQEVEDAMRELGVSRAKLNRDLAATKEIISDENASLEQKRKAIETVREAEGRQTAQELENAKKKLEAIRLQNSLKDDPSDEKLQEEADALAAVFQLEEKSANDIRSLNRQSRSIERAARAEAIAKQKEEQQKYVEFSTKLTKLQQDNELATITSAYEKELQALKFRIENEKTANEQAFRDRRLTKAQQQQLDAELDQQFANQKAALDKKNAEDVNKKQIEFEKELAAIATQIRVASIKDARELERVQLNIEHEERLKEAIERYGSDQAKFQEIKNALDEKLRLEQAKIDEKVQLDKDKAEFEKEIARQEQIVAANTFDFEAKQQAVDAEQELIQSAFDRKLITEQEYTSKISALTDARMKIAEAETNHKRAQINQIASTLSGLAELVGRQTAVGKALGIATALINTYQGASEALKQPSTLPSPLDVIAKVANVATIIGVGLKTVRDIAKVQVPGGGGGSASVPSSSGVGPVTAPAPVAPIAQSTKIVDTSVGDASKKEPIRAYVVDGDVRNAADRDARLARAAQFGGG